MNLYESDLFPHIEGAMMQKKRVRRVIRHVTVTTVDYADRKQAKTEVSVEGTRKTALLNKTETKKLIQAYGPNTDEWRGKPIVFYGEFGKWFGKEQWALRVDLDQTLAAWDFQQSPEGQAEREGEKAQQKADLAEAADRLNSAINGRSTKPAVAEDEPNF